MSNPDTTRIFNYPEVTTPASDAKILLDSQTAGSKCIDANLFRCDLIDKTITQRGTFEASEDDADGFKKVVVDIPYTDIHVASGPIATFEGEDLPLKSLTASIVPVQDLHGYDSPWVGGAGKNKFDQDTAYASYKQSDGSFRITGNAVTLMKNYIPQSLVGQQVTVSVYFDLTKEASPNGVRIACNIGGTETESSRVEANQKKTISLTFTPTASTDYWYITYGNTGANYFYFKECQLEEGSTATSFAPYSNICPISGWTGCNVGNLGSKNWYDTRQSLLAGYLDVGGTVGGKGQSVNKHTEKIPIKGGVTYTYSVAVSRNADQNCFWYDKNNNVIDGFSLLKNTTSITAQAPINAVSASLTVYNVDGQTIQLEAGSQATAYEPYNPNSTTTTIPFTDAQGNPVEVYGGSVDVVNGGEQPSTLGVVDLDNATMTTTNNRCYYNGVKTLIKVPTSQSVLGNYMAEKYKQIPFNGTLVDGEYAVGQDGVIIFYYDGVNKPTGKLVYELATPTTFYTQPTSIKSLDGENNVFASTGDVDVEYQTVWVRPTE